MELIKATNVPMPVTVRKKPKPGAGRKSKYNFKEMQHGDSFLTIDFIDGEKAKITLSSAINVYKNRQKALGTPSPFKFPVRLYMDDEQGREVLGVWCIDPVIEAQEKAAAQAELELEEAVEE